MWAKLIELNGNGSYGLTIEKETLVNAGIIDKDGEPRVEDLRLQQHYYPDEREIRIPLPSEERLDKLEKRERQASLSEAD